jgi:hypothetical protein
VHVKREAERRKVRLRPVAGFGIFCAYAAIAIAGTAVLLVRRDAWTWSRTRKARAYRKEERGFL